MKFPTYLHRNSFDIYYFRIAVPQKFRQYIAKTEIKKSLRTRSASLAFRRAQILAVEVHQLFDQFEMKFDENDWRLSKTWTADTFKVDFGNGKKIEAENLTVDPEEADAFNSTLNTLAGHTVADSEKPPAELFSELFNEYITVRKQRKANLRDATVKDYRQKADLFIEILGDRPINMYSHADADKLQDTLQQLPKNWRKSPKYRDFVTVHEVLSKKIPESDRLSVGTVNTFLTVISGIFRLAQIRGYIPFNPFAEKQILNENADDEKWISFSSDDLKKIFSSSYPTDQPSRYWVPLLGLYTGARLNELCQLRTEDITAIDGTYFIRFTDEGDGQQLKGRNSKRIIPIHDRILDLGFIDYLTSCSTDRLFPELTQDEAGHWDRKVRRWFNENYLKTVGVKRDKISFRSFRRTFATELRSAGVAETHVAELLGHSKGSFTSFKTYAGRGEVEPLITALNMLNFEIDPPKMESSR